MAKPKVDVSEAVAEKIKVHAKAAKMTNKEFVEKACMYFISRNLNPGSIKEGETLAILNHVTKEINRSIGFQIRQEKTLLFNLLKDVSFLELRFQILENNLFEMFNTTEADFKRISGSNRQYYFEKKKAIEERIQKLFEEIGH